MDLLPCIVSHSAKSTDCKVFCMTSTLARSRHSFEVNVKTYRRAEIKELVIFHTQSHEKMLTIVVLM